VRFKEADLHRLLAILREAAAVEIMPRFQAGAVAARAKTGPGDLVTEADVEAERRITAALRAWLPQALVIGEEAVESGAVDPAGLHAAELAFLLDPVDGTVNFASGTAQFVTMAAVVVQGVVQAGVIHDPVLERTLLALHGGGAWAVDERGQRTRLRLEARRAEAMRVVAYLPDWAAPVRGRLAQAAGEGIASLFAVRCSGHEYRLLATGGCDALAYAGPLKPWDHAAGLLILREAGGAAFSPQEQPAQALVPAGPLLAAASPQTLAALQRIMLSGGDASG
jgi:fructose-1,6-bisphosphatase/inositol monophosphatase family enzyme